MEPDPPPRTGIPLENVVARKTLFSTPSPLSVGVASTIDPSNQEPSTTSDNLTSEVLHYLPKPPDYKSPIWAHFNILDPKYHAPKIPGEREACCKHCKAILKFTKGLSSLWAHIRSHEKNDDYVKAFEAKSRANKRKMYQDLKATPKKEAKDRDLDILDATVCWVVEENVPFNMVEKKSFRQMCTSLFSGAPVITSLQVRTEIKSLGDVCKEAVQKELDGRHFALTTDHWTSKNSETYGCLTAHYIVNSELKRCVLHFEIHHGTTTGDALFANLLNVFESYEFDLSFVLAVTTDTTGNMNTFGRRLAQNGVIHLYCIDHNLHLTSKLAFDDTNLPEAENAMKAARSQVEFFNSSTQALEKLLHMQKTTRAGEKSLKLIQDVKTRWWSTWKMLQRLLQLTPTIDALIYSGQVNTNTLTATHKQVLSEIETLLSPMAKAQKMLEGDKYPTISSVPFIIWKLRENLKARTVVHQTDVISAATQYLACKMYSDFVDRRYGDGSTVFHMDYVLGRQQRYISLHKIVIVSAFLDPRFKNLHPFLPESDKPAVFSYVLQLMRTLAEHKNTSPQTDNAVIPSQAERPRVLDDIATGDDNDDLFAELITEPREDDDDITDDTAMICEAELNRYKGIKPIHHQQDPLKWWSENSLKFPILSTLAQRYLAIPATSASSERLWSRASNIITKSRTQLEGHVVADLIFLKENGHILEKHAESICGRTRFLPTIYKEDTPNQDIG